MRRTGQRAEDADELLLPLRQFGNRARAPIRAAMRGQQMARGLKPWAERLGLALWGCAAQQPALYALGTRIAVRVMKWMGGSEKLIHRLPFVSGWTDGRDFPAPEGQTFRELYRRSKR